MKTFTLRLTDEEAEIVDIMATVMRLSKNSFIRGCIHQAAEHINEFAGIGCYRPKACDLVKQNQDLFDAIIYDKIDIFNEHFEDIEALKKSL